MSLNEVYSIKLDGHVIYINENGSGIFFLENIPDFLKDEITEIIKCMSNENKEMVH